METLSVFFDLNTLAKKSPSKTSKKFEFQIVAYPCMVQTDLHRFLSGTVVCVLDFVFVVTGSILTDGSGPQSVGGET